MKGVVTMTELEGCVKSAGIQTIAIANIGWVKFVVFQGDEQVNSAIQLLSIFVEPQMRGNGYSKRLLDCLSNYARENNVNYIFVHVSQHNSVLQHIIAKQGVSLRGDKLLFTKST